MSEYTVLHTVIAPCFQPLLSPARYKGAHGGRGSGKSHFFAERLIERCYSRPGTRWVCLREYQKSLKQSSKLLIEDKIVLFGLQNSFRIMGDEIETPGGGVIIFNGLQEHTADSIRSLEGFDGAWFDEAHRASARSLSLLRPTIRKDGSEMWFSWNPHSRRDPIERLLCPEKGDPPEDAVVVEANFRTCWRQGCRQAEGSKEQGHNPARGNLRSHHQSIGA